MPLLSLAPLLVASASDQALLPSAGSGAASASPHHKAPQAPPQPFLTPFLLLTNESLHACEHACDGQGCPAGYFTNAYGCKCHCQKGDKPSPLFFYEHIPKTGGKLFVDDARSLGGLTGCGEIDLKDSEDEDPMQLQDAINAYKLHDDNCNLIASEGHMASNVKRMEDVIKKEDIQMLVMLRQPREHVLSMYHHCQHPQGLGRATHDYHTISHSDYFKLALEGSGPQLEKYCSYYPANMMTRLLAYDAFGEMLLPEAKGTVDNAGFVGLFEQYELSLCLLGAHVQGHLPEGCSCDKAAYYPAPPLREEHRTKWMRFDAHSTNYSLSELDRERLANLTAMDQELYTYARARFNTDVVDHGLGCWLKPVYNAPRV